MGQLQKAFGSSQAAQPEAQPALPDPLGRTTPRGTVVGFLTAAYGQNYDAAAQYLDTRSRGAEADQLARQLFFVLDRRLPAKLNTVSNDPRGSLSDPIDSRRELIGSVVTDSGGVDVYLTRIDRPNGSSIWLFSRQTLADIPDVYNEINAANAENILPDVLLRKYFGISLFGWCFVFVFLPLLYVALSALNKLLGVAVGYSVRRWTNHREMPNPTLLPHPLRLLILSLTVFATLSNFSLTLADRQVGSILAKLLLIVACVWAMFLVNARVELYLKRGMEARGRISATAVLRPARRVMDVIGIIAGFMFFLHTLGINPSATLAGLGVGGIAVALAAQKTLENVIGGASLILDGAVRVGDVFKVGEVVGTIETVGLRSTRVRTIDRTVITIPNGQMATMILENFSARDRFWIRQLIPLAHQTSSSALSSLLDAVRTLLEGDARVLPETARVRILRFAEGNLELEVCAYVSSQDLNGFLEIQEDLLMRIRELMSSAGVEIAYPARAIYFRNEVKGDDASVGSLLRGTVAGEERAHELHVRE